MTTGYIGVEVERRPDIKRSLPLSFLATPERQTSNRLYAYSFFVCVARISIKGNLTIISTLVKCFSKYLASSSKFSYILYHALY